MSSNKTTTSGALILAAIGVVYGDIGTSVLYATKEVFSHDRVQFTIDNVYGILSMFFWTLTVIVSLKYVVLVLRADNEGEGGLVAMLALASTAVAGNKKLRRTLLIVGIFGTSLFYGDGVITPAISVLSAVEGLEVVSPQFKHYVIPITLAVLFCLFVVQKHGTAGIGRYFGPVTLTWFLVIGILGVSQIVHHPEILKAISPYYALSFMWNNPLTAFLILGATVLCVTGAEALYADLGHFGKGPIRIAWFSVVMPALVLNYFGQGALLLENPAAVKNPFFMMAPDWALVPLVVLATLATVIASQALITGAFSVTRQVIQLGYLPRLNIEHTSVRTAGQIYIPFVNWGLFVAIVLAVLMFRSSSNLAAAYGIAVTTDMLITTILTFFVIRYAWKLPLALCVASTAVFFVVDFAFFSSNLLKLPDGGWFPLMIGGFIFTLMLTWKEGRKLMGQVQRTEAIDLKAFLSSVFVNPPARVDGTAVFLTSEPGVVPNALLHNLKHNKVLHEQNLFVTVRNHEVPWIPMDKRIDMEPLGHHCWQVVVHYGFKNDIDLPRALESARMRGCQLEPMATSYFLSRDVVIPTLGSGMAPWREKLFAQMHHNASGAADFLSLPNNAVVELGSKIEDLAPAPRDAGFESSRHNRPMRFFKDLSLSAFVAGFVAVLVGFTSSVAIVFQAAQAFGATPAMIASWMWALGIGMGLASALPSLWLKKPVMIAWSTPGAAVLAVAGAGYNMNEAVGAFIVCAVLITIAGATGWFERVMNKIPMEIASALLAGVLARFGLQAFLAAQTALVLVLVMLATYLIARRVLPRYAVPLTLVVAIVYAAARGQLAWSGVHFELATPIFTMPVFSWQAAVSVALPLFVVTMASQNLPGVAAIRAAGYDMPISKIITFSGLATLVLAPFGAFALNLSAITAAICMGREAHEDPARRYTAAVSCGAIYVLIGFFGAAVTGLLTAFPKELVAAIAGLALLGTIGNGMAVAVRDESHREAALITFLVTLSGVTLGGVGSAFWGVVAGAAALAIQGIGRRRANKAQSIGKTTSP